MINESNTVCAICGHVCKPRGLGAHMRLKHGIKVKTVVKHISDSSDSSDSSGRVQRPSDWKNKKERVVASRIDKADPPLTQELDYVGKYKCTVCGKYYSIDEYSGRNFAGNENVTECWDCHVEKNSARDELGRRMCINCGCWFGKSIPSYERCITGKEHVFKDN